jgi:Tat protein translocase TatB subunit
MFDISFWKLVLIFAVGLVVLGPEKLPKVAAQLGSWAGQARRMARVLTTQLREELEKEEQRQTEAAAGPRPASTPPPAPAADTYSRPGMDELRGYGPPEPTAAREAHEAHEAQHAGATAADAPRSS